MKKSIFQVAVVTALLFSATLSFAQPYGGAYHNPRTPHRPAPGTILYGGGFAVSNHSISAQVLGLEYSFDRGRETDPFYSHIKRLVLCTLS